MTLIIDYFKLQKEYTKIHGDNTVVFQQKGTFYNCYSYDPTKCDSDVERTDKNGNIWKEQIGVAHRIESYIRADLTRTNNNVPYSILEPDMAGFPTIGYEKRRKALLEVGYTIIRVDEVEISEKGKKKFLREVAEIISPSTDIETPPNTVSNNIAVIFIEYQSCTRKDFFEEFSIISSIAIFDVVTGKNSASEFYSSNDNQIICLQDIYRVLLASRPREVLVYINDLPEELLGSNELGKYSIFVNNMLQYHKYEKWTTYENKVDPKIFQISYQMEFFNTIFARKYTNVISHIDDKIFDKVHLNNKSYSRIAYILLIQHCNKYTGGVVANINPPSWIDSDRHLILAHNTSEQLNLISNLNKQSDTLLNILDYTNTKMGKRYLAELIQNPITDVNILNDSYSIVEELFENYQKIQSILNVIPCDLEKVHRRLKAEVISPKELKNLFKSYNNIIEIYVLICNSQGEVIKRNLLNNSDITSFNNFLTRFTSIIDYEKLNSSFYVDDDKKKCIDFSENFVKSGYFPEIDQLWERYSEAKSEILSIVDELNIENKVVEFVNKKRKVGVKKSIPTDYILQIADNKLKFIHSKMELMNIKYTDIGNSKYSLSSAKITSLLNEINLIRNTLGYKFYSIYQSIVNTMINEYSFYNSINNLVARIDVWCSFAKVTKLNKYYKPKIEIGENSFVDFKNIRHPIIEKITNNKYITNDVILGRTYSGMLLFGLNQVGKTTLAKAVALNVIMAQIGCYTAGELTYYPFNKIITRLQGGDNFSNGESTFAVEMGELRTILRQSDNRTLVVGDEIAHSSDIISANGITVSAVQCLCDVKTCFIFATHVHSVLEVPVLQELIDSSIIIRHLSTTRNEEGLIICNRKLQEGPGDPVYGVMVAESLGLPRNFISRAYSVVNYLKNANVNVVSSKTSKYNSKVYMSNCCICGSSENLHSHHIEEQKYADKQGFINSMHKNIKGNIAVLCEHCHHKLHSRGEELTTLQTLNGMVVVKE